MALYIGGGNKQKGTICVVENAHIVTEIENIIDQGGVLDSTEGTATEKVEQLIDYAGLKAVFQNTIDNMSHNETRYVFANCQMTEEQIALFDFSKAIYLQYTFAYNEAIKNINIDTSSATAITFAFKGCSNLETVVLSDTSKVREWNAPFNGCSKLKSVGTLDFSSATSYITSVLSGLANLETVKIVPETISSNFVVASAKLTAESIQSIIDGLAYVETAQTLTLNSEVLEKLTDEQLAIIANKNWTTA